MPIVDDDPDEPFCTPPEDPLSEYVCVAMKCNIERAMDTEDSLYDVIFEPVVGTEDMMILRRHR